MCRSQFYPSFSAREEVQCASGPADTPQVLEPPPDTVAPVLWIGLLGPNTRQYYRQWVSYEFVNLEFNN